MGNVLIYVGAILPLLWGIAHLIPTRSIVRGFGEIGQDNRNIITMEWIIEGVALIFLGLLIVFVTAIDASNVVSRAVYLSSSGFLIMLAVVSVFTGFKVRFIPFKLCPVIFVLSAILICSGSLMIHS